MKAADVTSVAATTRRPSLEAKPSVLERIAALGVVPVLEIEDADLVELLAEALLEAGLPCVEVMFRTAAASHALKRLANYAPELLVGAGTVITVEQVDEAILGGAEFIVAPGMTRAVVEHCIATQVTVLPGICTPSEIGDAISCGINVMKFFPAEACGGISYLNAIAAPFRSVQFVPTGGITSATLGEYLKHPQVVACGGSWMVRKELLASKDFATVRRLAAEAVSCAKSAREERPPHQLT